MLEEPDETAGLVTDEDGEHDLTSLLGMTLSEVVAPMSEEEATAYIATLLEDSEIETEHSLFVHVTPQVTTTLKVTDYRPDQAVREASLAKKEQWRPGKGEIAYHASNALEVYLEVGLRS